MAREPRPINLGDCWSGDKLSPLPPDVLRRASEYLLHGWGYAGTHAIAGVDRERWIYFIQGDDGGPVKIGFTNNIKWRASEISGGYPFGALRIVGLILGQTADEKALHRRFDSIRLRGEWFMPTDELRAFIRSLQIPEALR